MLCLPQDMRMWWRTACEDELHEVVGYTQVAHTVWSRFLPVRHHLLDPVRGIRHEPDPRCGVGGRRRHERILAPHKARLEGVGRALSHLVCVHLLEQPIAACAVADVHHDTHIREHVQVTHRAPEEPIELRRVQVRDAVDAHHLTEAQRRRLAAQLRNLEHQRMRRHLPLQILCACHLLLLAKQLSAHPCIHKPKKLIFTPMHLERHITHNI